MPDDLKTRELIPGRPIAPGEVVLCPSGTLAVVKHLSPGGAEATVELAPGGQYAAFRARHLRRPYQEPARLVFIGLPDASDEAANDAAPDPEAA